MTIEEQVAELEERAEIAEAEADVLKGDVALLKRLVGYDYLTGKQLSEADFRKILTPANEMPNGDYALGIGQKLTNYIDRDAAAVDANHEARIKTLEARPSGSVSIPTDFEAFPLPTPSGETHDAGDVEGFGNGFHLKSGRFEALVFISDYDNALRILTNHKANADGGHTYAIETEGQQRIDVETFGVGVSYWPPRKNPDGSDFPLTTLDKQGGKSIIFRSHSPDNHRAPYAQIYTGLPGQGLQIGVSAGKRPDGSPIANAMVAPTIQIEPDGTKSIG